MFVLACVTSMIFSLRFVCKYICIYVFIVHRIADYIHIYDGIIKCCNNIFATIIQYHQQQSPVSGGGSSEVLELGTVGSTLELLVTVQQVYISIWTDIMNTLGSGSGSGSSVNGSSGSMPSGIVPAIIYTASLQDTVAVASVNQGTMEISGGSVIQEDMEQEQDDNEEEESVNFSELLSEVWSGVNSCNEFITVCLQHISSQVQSSPQIICAPSWNAAIFSNLCKQCMIIISSVPNNNVHYIPWFASMCGIISGLSGFVQDGSGGNTQLNISVNIIIVLSGSIVRKLTSISATTTNNNTASTAVDRLRLLYNQIIPLSSFINMIIDLNSSDDVTLLNYYKKSNMHAMIKEHLNTLKLMVCIYILVCGYNCMFVLFSVLRSGRNAMIL